ADVTVYSGGAASLSAVISDNDDIYIGVPAIGMRAIAQGQDVQIFGSIMTEYASNVVIQGDLAREKGLDENSSVEDRIS
ncbi:MAG: hypothetical protein P5685_26485, partial [Limnospira sp. PMC 1261.20]|uniref:hypothetical protein n=1 Tax=Limnospira sp. PMC 1261.20 TaxID=2981059 RepID=UPI0028E16EB2